MRLPAPCHCGMINASENVAMSEAALRAMTQQMVGQNQRHHGFANRHRPDADARIMTAGGRDLDIMARGIASAARGQNRGGWLDGKAHDYSLTGGVPTLAGGTRGGSLQLSPKLSGPGGCRVNQWGTGTLTDVLHGKLKYQAPAGRGPRPQRGRSFRKPRSDRHRDDSGCRIWPNRC